MKLITIGSGMHSKQTQSQVNQHLQSRGMKMYSTSLFILNQLHYEIYDHLVAWLDFLREQRTTVARTEGLQQRRVLDARSFSLNGPPQMIELIYSHAHRCHYWLKPYFVACVDKAYLLHAERIIINPIENIRVDHFWESSPFITINRTSFP
jgi:hypothetical protein